MSRVKAIKCNVCGSISEENSSWFKTHIKVLNHEGKGDLKKFDVCGSCISPEEIAIVPEAMMKGFKHLKTLGTKTGE